MKSIWVLEIEVLWSQISKYFSSTYHKILFIFAIEAIFHAVEASLFLLFILARQATKFSTLGILNQALWNKNIKNEDK